MTRLRHKERSRSVSHQLDFGLLTLFLTAAQEELINLVDAYKSRKFDEDIRATENLGGKFGTRLA
jgi:hypothetical protein